MSRPLRVLAILEALTVTGPAKNLLQFGRVARETTPPVDLRLITYRRPENAPMDAFLAAAADAGVPVDIIAEKAAMDVSVVGKLKRLVEQIQPDVLQTHNAKSHFLVRLTGLHRQHCWVAYHHGYTIPTRRQQLYNQLDRWSLRAARRVITVTGAFRKELLVAGVKSERIEVISNAIESTGQPTTGRGDIRRKHGIGMGIPVVLAVGRLSREKAHIDLLKAVRLLGDAEMPHVILVGDGPERQALEVAARQFGVPVTFAGQIDQVRPYYEESDLFVLPSLSEGSPNVLLEAMAAGMAIVATNVGGVGETVSPDEAVVVPAGDPTVISNAIRRLLVDPEHRLELGRAAQLRCQRDFSPQRRAAAIVACYQRLLDRRTE